MEEIPADIQTLVRERRKIDAIRELRLRTGLGLKEAKDRIDALERQLGIVTPRSQAAKSLLFWFIVVIVGLAIFWASTRLQTP